MVSNKGWCISQDEKKKYNHYFIDEKKHKVEAGFYSSNSIIILG